MNTDMSHSSAIGVLAVLILRSAAWGGPAFGDHLGFGNFDLEPVSNPLGLAAAFC